jgi:hypothetical protein
VVASVPCLQAHPLLQSVAASVATHLWTRVMSVVRSIGAQKSCAGINSLPSDQLHPVVIEQVVASVFSTQTVHSASVVSLLTVTGWQNSAEKRGCYPG